MTTILNYDSRQDEFNKSTMGFDRNILSQLLFCDLYAIETMEIKDGKLHLYMHYSGATTPYDKERCLSWNQRQFDGKSGVVEVDITLVPPMDKQPQPEPNQEVQ